MCGIYGYSSRNEESLALMPYLAWAMQGRGKDGWGGTDGVKMIKHLGPAVKSFNINEIKDCKALICHTRGASVGNVTIENQHPFEFVRNTGEKVIGVHNGHINNWKELNTAHHRNFEVDSMHCFAHIAEGKSLAELEGWGVLAYFDGGGMRFGKFNSNDLHFAKLESGPVVFCSTRETIDIAAQLAGVEIKYFYETHPDQMMDLYDDVLHEGEAAKISKPRVVLTPNHAWEHFGHAEWGSSSGTSSIDRHRFAAKEFSEIGVGSRKQGSCLKCSTTSVNRSKHTLCDSCVDRLLALVRARMDIKVMA